MKKILFIFVIIIIFSALVRAEVPELINYQGNITEAGVPMNGMHKIEFEIYDSLEGGTLIWGGELQNIHITNGLFSSYIGKDMTPPSPVPFADIDWGTGLKYLQITINGKVMAPREYLTSVAFALYAKKAKNAENVEKSPPPYTIVMYAGSIASIPVGWALCDGNSYNGTLTPDLRDKFILGTGVQGEIKQTGGSHSRTLAVANLPSHNHSASCTAVGNHTHIGTTDSAGGHSHGYGDKHRNTGNGIAAGSGHSEQKIDEARTTSHAGAHTHTFTTAGAGSHSHTITIGNTGSGAAFDIKPAYVKLAYIMKLP